MYIDYKYQRDLTALGTDSLLPKFGYEACGRQARVQILVFTGKVRPKVEKEIISYSSFSVEFC